jgi:hypothetical protein
MADESMAGALTCESPTGPRRLPRSAATLAAIDVKASLPKEFTLEFRPAQR